MTAALLGFNGAPAVIDRALVGRCRA